MQRSILSAAILAALFSTLAAATQYTPEATDYVLDDIVVTATRFEVDQVKTPGQVVIITQRDIDNTPAANVPDLLAGALGVDVFPLYGSLGIDASISLRGAGTSGTMTSNTLILLNGQRLNPIDAGSIDWSLVPIPSIERIEILPGNGTVLYGDRASGGVINIITKKPVSDSYLKAGAGSHGLREASGQFGRVSDGWGVSLYAQHGKDDGWRVNSEQRRTAVGGRLSLGHDAAKQGYIDLAAFDETLGTPGGLWSAEYAATPSASRHPEDSSDRKGYRIRPGFQYKLAPGLEFEADLVWSRDERLGYSDATNPVEQTRMLDRDFGSFSPRLKVSHRLGGVPGNVTFGIDWFRGTTETLTSPVGFQSYTQAAEQESYAFYIQDVSDLTEHFALTLGARSQHMKQVARQSAYTIYYGAPQPAVSGASSDTRTAFDAGLSYQHENWRLYGKVGTVFRFPNTDELYGLDVYWNPVFAADLKPQHGLAYELGLARKLSGGRLTLTLYRQDLQDEITSNPNGGNMNIDKTRRQGFEVGARLRLLNNLTGSVGYSAEQAEVRAGAYAGYDLPLVPRHKASAALSWEPSGRSSYSLRLNHVGERRYGDDYENVAGDLSGYTTLDLLGAWSFANWRIEAKVLNITDQKYAAFAGYGFNTDTYEMDTFYYPANRRSFQIAARYEFR